MKGGYCPGAGRIWPKPGYWSQDENSAPVQCAVAEACLGLADDEGNIIGTPGNTQQCNTELGYEGEYCAQCVPSFFSTLKFCQSCGPTAADRVEFNAKVPACTSVCARACVV